MPTLTTHKTFPVNGLNKESACLHTRATLSVIDYFGVLEREVRSFFLHWLVGLSDDQRGFALRAVESHFGLTLAQ